MSKKYSKNDEKLSELESKLEYYEKKLEREMKGYRGVIHESAASEIKHTTVMVLKAMVGEIRDQIDKIKKNKV